jgi:hypothetical protein
VVEDFPKTPATGRIQKILLKTQPPGPAEWDRLRAAKAGLGLRPDHDPVRPGSEP